MSTISADELKEFLARFVSNELGEAEKTLESLHSASPKFPGSSLSVLIWLTECASKYGSLSRCYREAACVIHANHGRAEDVRDALARAAFAQLQVFEREPKPATVQEEELLEGLRTYKCAKHCLDGFHLSLGAGEFGIARRLAGFARNLPLMQDFFTDIQEPVVGRPLAYSIRDLVENHPERALAHLADVVPTNDGEEKYLFQADMVRGMTTGDVGLFAESLGRLLAWQGRVCAEQPFPVDIALAQLCLPALAIVNLALYRQFLTLALVEGWIGDRNPHLPLPLLKLGLESPGETVDVSRYARS